MFVNEKRVCFFKNLCVEIGYDVERYLWKCVFYIA